MTVTIIVFVIIILMICIKIKETPPNPVDSHSIYHSKTYKQVYQEYYNKACGMLIKFNDADYIKKELIPFMQIFACWTLSAENAQRFLEETNDFISTMVVTNSDKAFMNRRKRMYQRLADYDYLIKADWMTDTQKASLTSDLNYPGKLVAIFGDIALNKDYSENYESAYQEYDDKWINFNIMYSNYFAKLMYEYNDDLYRV